MSKDWKDIAATVSGGLFKGIKGIFKLIAKAMGAAVKDSGW